MATTFHSEYLKMATVCLKPAEAAFCNNAKLSAEWQSLQYLAKPDLEKSWREYAGFRSLLQLEGIHILELPADPQLSMDSIYCRDASVATNFGMILCNMGKPARKGEPVSHKRMFDAHQIPVLGTIDAPGTLEGGDVAWLDENTLAVGHSYRTNTEGIRQLGNILALLGIQIIVVDLPHHKGPSDVFHLMSVVSPVDRDLAVVYSPLLPIGFRNTLLEKGFTLVEVPEGEYVSMGCNVLAVAPRKCILLKGNPRTEAGLIANGCEVLSYEGREISLKGGGGPTCLTRPLERYVPAL